MKRILYLAFAVLLSSCLSEKNADPGKPATFVRYFNGGNDDYAKVAEETSDGGIILLGTTKIVSLTDSSKIKLIKTDNYGNLLFQKVYPANFKSKINLSGNAMIQLASGGFMVIGNYIQSTRTDLFILEVNSQLDSVKSRRVDFSAFGITESILGQAIQLNTNGNFLVLGSLKDVTKTSNNMVLAELDKSNFSVIWARAYGNGESSLANKIYLDGSNNVFWSGTVTRNSSTPDIRIVKTAQNSIGTISDQFFGKAEFEEEANDICRYGYGFAIVGSTNESPTGTLGDQNIIFKIIAQDGITELLSKSIAASSDTDTGNSISSVRGGLVILGTVKVAEQDDYFLTKYDAFGNQVWTTPRIFGNKSKNDRGASVRQLTDGSLLVLGTTDFGGVKTMMLMKADSEGNIE